MEIIFVRHAQKEKGVSDPALTERGLKQAKALAKKIKREKVNNIYCSDLKRARQTSLIIGKKSNIKPIVSKSLNEFSIDILKNPQNHWSKDLKEQYANLKKFLSVLTKNPNANKKILIVAHGNTNRLILSILLELSLENLVRFGQIETAVNEVYWLESFKNWRLREWNNTNHLPDRLRSPDMY